MSKIESRTIKARHEIGIDSYKGKLSRKDLMDVKPFDHRKATEIRFVDWITGDREILLQLHTIYMANRGDKRRLGPGLVLVHSYVYYNRKYHSRGNTALEK